MLKRSLSLIILIGAAALLSGCSTNATVSGMAYKPAIQQAPKNVALANAIAVNDIAGGHETNPLWNSQINNENFKTALVQSLQQAGLYHELVNSHYKLDATLIKLHQPFLGLNLKVVCEVRYILTNTQTGKTLYDKNIVTPYTTTFSDSLLFVIRLRLANEGAAKANIKQLIEDLDQLTK